MDAGSGSARGSDRTWRQRSAQLPTRDIRGLDLQRQQNVDTGPSVLEPGVILTTNMADVRRAGVTGFRPAKVLFDFGRCAGSVSMMACLVIEGVPMSRLLTKTVVRCVSLSMLMVPMSSSAQTSLASDPRCEAVYKYADGSWINRLPLMFGRRVRIEVGTTIYKGTVIGGIDVGAVLDRQCAPAAYDLPVIRF